MAVGETDYTQPSQNPQLTYISTRTCDWLGNLTTHSLDSMLVTASSVASKQTNKLSFVFGGTVGSSATVVSAGTLSKHFLKNFPQTLSAKTFSQNVYGF